VHFDLLEAGNRQVKPGDGFDDVLATHALILLWTPWTEPDRPASRGSPRKPCASVLMWQIDCQTDCPPRATPCVL
jgi:hypothetical protein